ncbi:MAG: hypothetical protein FWH35_00280 [Treponema sp.]|nr:hypothetical protein [Treponema sp.]
MPINGCRRYYKFINKHINILKNLTIKFKLFIFNFLNIIFSNNKNDKILIIEPNKYHGEIIPGYVDYFIKLNFNVHVIINRELYDTKPFYMFCFNKFNYSIVEKNKIDTLFCDKILMKYEKIVITSESVNTKINGIYKNIDFYTMYPSAKKYSEKIFFIQHLINIKEGNDIYLNNLIMLENFDDSFGNCYKGCTPFYFGKIRSHEKNNITNFIIVGAILNKRRNYELLIETIRKLHFSGKKNFIIKILGRGDIFEYLNEDSDKELYKYFIILGRVDYPVMHKAIESSDFILMLLDPENEIHIEKYLKYGTSGNFQLSYGFLKPCIINEIFAEKRQLNNRNAIVYEKNDDLVSAMSYAIEMNKNSYKEMQKNLRELTNNIYNNSLKTLKEIFINGE